MLDDGVKTTTYRVILTNGQSRPLDGSRILQAINAGIGVDNKTVVNGEEVLVAPVSVGEITSAVQSALQEHYPQGGEVTAEFVHQEIGRALVQNKAYKAAESYLEWRNNEAQTCRIKTILGQHKVAPKPFSWIMIKTDPKTQQTTLLAA